jgi:hypothetical protein
VPKSRVHLTCLNYIRAKTLAKSRAHLMALFRVFQAIDGLL